METVSILLKLFFCYQEITVIGYINVITNTCKTNKHVQNKPTKKKRHYQKRKINDRESKIFYFVVNKGNNKINELRAILQRESPNS